MRRSQLRALGLVTIMVFAAAFHVAHGEFPPVVFNAVLGSIAAFIAWGRGRKVIIAPRGQG